MSRKTIQRQPGIGQRLQEERLRIGHSQEGFGVICGVSRIAQFNYERGQRVPDADYLVKADSAGADILYVVTGRRSGEKSEQVVHDVDRLVAEIDSAVRRSISKVLGTGCSNKPEKGESK